MTESKRYDADRTRESPESAPKLVSVRRILSDWSFANDEPLAEDDYDRIIAIAAGHVRTVGR